MNPIVHADDPESSWLAAEAHAEAREKHMDMVLRVLQQHPGSTAAELARHIGAFDVVEIRRRLTDLRAAGAAFRGHPRKCTVADNTQCEWWPREVQAALW